MKTVALGEVVDFYSGATPLKSKLEFWNGDIPWFSAKDMKQPRLVDSTTHVADSVFKTSRLRKLPAGTVAMVVRGMILAHTVPISILDVEAAINQDLKALLPRQEIDNSFLASMLRAQHDTILRQVGTAAHGTKKLESRVLENIKIPLPPLDEQRRIAAILDHADALRMKRRQVLAYLDSLSQSIFQDMFGDARQPTTALGDLCEFYSGGTPSKQRADFWSGLLPWFSAKDLKSDDLVDSQDHISEKVLDETRLRLLPADTVVLVVRGMILAHTAPIGVLRVPGAINQDLKAVLPRDGANADFLAASLRASADWMLARVSTAAHGTKKLESSVLEAVPIPIANPSTQELFAKRVEQVNARRKAAQRALDADDELFATLQSCAFRGEL